MLIFRKAFKLRGKELILKTDRLLPGGLNINNIKNKQMKEIRESLNENEKLLIF